MNYDVVTMGYIFNENIIYPDRKEGPVLGGTVAYSSVCLGRLGTITGIVSNIDKDTPDNLIEPFRDALVDTSGLNMREGISTTKNQLIYDHEGNKEIKYLKRAPLIRYEDIPEKYFNTKYFYLCLVDYEVPLNTLEKIRDRGKYDIVCDLGGIGGAHSSIDSRKKYSKNSNKILQKYLMHISIAKASIEDCQNIFGKKFKDPEKIALKLIEMGSRMVIITLGEKGSFIKTVDETFNINAIETRVADTTGAGDTFTSAFLSEFIISSDIKRAGIFATAASSLLIEKKGGVNVERFPVRDAVLKRMKRYKDF